MLGKTILGADSLPPRDVQTNLKPVKEAEDAPDYVLCQEGCSCHEDCSPCTQLVVTMAHVRVGPPALRCNFGWRTNRRVIGCGVMISLAKAVLEHDIAEGDRLRRCGCGYPSLQAVERGSGYQPECPKRFVKSAIDYKKERRFAVVMAITRLLLRDGS
jgi:hypothetical protein